MSQTETILEMKAIGFSQGDIAQHLGLSQEQVAKEIKTHTHPIQNSLIKRKTKDRPAVKLNSAPTSSLSPEHTSLPPILEVKPGFYILTAEDLLAFATRLKETATTPADPFQDYVQKEIFMKQFGISETTLHRHQKEGRLKIYKLGNKQYLRKSQVVTALEKGKL